MSEKEPGRMEGVRKESVTIKGVEMYDNGAAWGVNVGVRSLMFDKEKFNALGEDDKGRLLDSLRTAHEAALAGESPQKALKPALEIVKKFGL